MTEILPRQKVINFVVIVPIILSFWASVKVIADEFTHIYNDEICYISDTIPIINITEVSSEISEENILTKDEYSSQQAKIEEEKRQQEEQKRLEAERVAEEARKAEEARLAEEARKAAEAQQAAEQQTTAQTTTTQSSTQQVVQEQTPQVTTTTASQSEKLYTIDQFEFMGIVMWNGYKFSYYSERVLPGTGLNIPGRNTTDGFVKDGDGYIVAAVNGTKGSIIPTPFGAYAKVYDFCVGCASNQVDLYTR